MRSLGMAIADSRSGSVMDAAATLAHGLMSYYKNNATDTAFKDVGTFPYPPYYWWESGAIWGGMVDYWAYTGDTSYVETTTQALMAQAMPTMNFMAPDWYFSLGNDDQAFWAIACLNAAEYDFPVPAGNASTVWLDLAEGVFNSQVARWDMSNCNGGLRWQIFPQNNGYDYKNSISNGALFQISARLAKLTGNQTYVDWANKAWDWMAATGLIDSNFNVFDGAEIPCTTINKVMWSYNPSMLLYGSAVLFNYTNGDSVWENRTTELLKTCINTFFSPYPNATNIMYEWACETYGTCDTDQYSFKAYLSRWMAQSTVVAPYIHAPVLEFLNVSANAAAQSCSGGNDSQTCGQKWYVGGYDGSFGVGQQLSALETVQSLLLLHGV